MVEGWEAATHISSLNTTVLCPYTGFLHRQQMGSTHSDGSTSTAEMGKGLRLPPTPCPEITKIFLQSSEPLTLDPLAGARLYMGRTTLCPY